jgi:SAM-dependent methyltransferase
MANEDQIEHWAGAGGDLWVAEMDRLDRMLGPMLGDLVAALDPQPGERVLDVGCGTGALSWAVAEHVGPGGTVVGVDLSPQMLELARTRGSSESARFVQADAQTTTVEGEPFDAWTSRFGVMFFDDPPAAFARLTSALRPGGRVAFACWQELAANEWLLVPALAALEHVPAPNLPDGDRPGPFSLADPQRLRTLLAGAGLTDLALTPLQRRLPLGRSAEDATTYLMHTEMARTLVAGADEATVARVREAVVTALGKHSGDDGVVLDGAVWLVTARR